MMKLNSSSKIGDLDLFVKVTDADQAKKFVPMISPHLQYVLLPVIPVTGILTPVTHMNKLKVKLLDGWPSVKKKVCYHDKNQRKISILSYSPHDKPVIATTEALSLSPIKMHLVWTFVRSVNIFRMALVITIDVQINSASILMNRVGESWNTRLPKLTQGGRSVQSD